MHRMTRVSAGAVAVLSATLLTACASGPGAPSGGPTPEAFSERAPLPPCEPVVLGQGEEVPQEANDCLMDAGADGAELAITRPTVEADPVTEYYRVLPGGGWEYYTDMTQDAYGGGWWLNTCPDATALDDLGECTTTEL